MPTSLAVATAWQQAAALQNHLFLSSHTLVRGSQRETERQLGTLKTKATRRWRKVHNMPYGNQPMVRQLTRMLMPFLLLLLVLMPTPAHAQTWGTVTDSSAVPQRYVGKVISRFPHGIVEGTGTLVGPKHVLTAAHMVYDTARRSSAISIMFVPGCGLRPGYQGVQQPFGSAWALKSSSVKAYMDGDLTKDVAIIKLDRRIGDRTRGWMELADWQLGMDYHLNCIGYPTVFMSGVVQRFTSSYWQRYDAGGQWTIMSLGLRVDGGVTGRGGVSGAPLFHFSGGKWLVRGVVRGQAFYPVNARGTRLTWPLVLELRNWIAANQ